MNNKNRVLIRKDIFSWCLYDWANSAFALIVVTGFFPVFFKSYYSGADDAIYTTLRLGIGNTVAGILIAVLSLVLGAVAGARKKRFLGFFVIMGTLSAAALFFVPQGAWIYALLFFILGNIGFSCANLFYDALLTDVSDESSMDMVSSAGFSFGYIGGVIPFALCLLMISRADDGVETIIRLSFVGVAAWWALFSVPLFLFVKEKGRVRKMSMTLSATAAVIKKTFLSIVKKPAILLFLCAYWMYFDGVNTFIRMSVDFGLSIGFGQSALMTALIIVQAVAFPSSLLFGHLSARVGAGRMIFAGVTIYVLISVFGSLFMRTETHFIILAAISGLAQGGIQALSRSYFGKLIPQDQSAEYFSFYNIVSRFAVVGPAVIGIVASAARGMGASGTTASRIGMSSTALFFIAGLILLIMVFRVQGTGYRGQKKNQNRP